MRIISTYVGNTKKSEGNKLDPVSCLLKMVKRFIPLPQGIVIYVGFNSLKGTSGRKKVKLKWKSVKNAKK